MMGLLQNEILRSFWDTAENPEDWGQVIVQASWLGLYVQSTVDRKFGSSAAWQRGDA